MKDKDYNLCCDKCGTCGYVACDGIFEFLKEHVVGKTDCKNESSVLCDIIELVNDSVHESMRIKRKDYKELFDIKRSKPLKE